MNGLLAWMRANPMVARQILKPVVALPLGIVAGGVLLVACSAFDLTPNVAAVGAAVATLYGSIKLTPVVAKRLGIPEP